MRTVVNLACWLVLGLGTAGCSEPAVTPVQGPGAAAALTSPSEQGMPTAQPEVEQAMELTSSAWKNGERIPVQYSGDGANVPPPLAWSHVPKNAVELALICDDPDAPQATPWVHWVWYGLPAHAVAGLADGVENIGDKAGGTVTHGKNELGAAQYTGPKPPKGHGVHHYHFRLYALDAHLNLPAGKSKDELVHAMEGHVVAVAEYVGTYER